MKLTAWKRSSRDESERAAARAEAQARRAAPQLSSIYAREAAMPLSQRNPIVFIPGIMGSKLVDVDSAQSVWGDFSRRFADPTRGANRRLIALQMQQGVPLDRLASISEADGAVREALPRRLPIRVGAYGDIMASVGVGGMFGGRQQLRPDYAGGGAFASFEFGYDWRRSLDETARRFDEFLRMATYFVQASRGTSDPVKFDVVAHSMGGLVLRYYLRYGGQLLPHDGAPPRLTWAGVERVGMAILIGTPNAGSVMALERLVGGLPARKLVHPGYDPFLLGTMPALYQLMPRSRHRPYVDADGSDGMDLFDPEFWIAHKWGLASPAGDALLAAQLEGVDTPAGRRATALDHLAKCLQSARLLHEALDFPARPPAPLEMHLIAGDSLSTPAVVAPGDGEGKLRIVRHAAGDKTVLRSSALLDERVGREWTPFLETPVRWSSVIFAAANHMALTRDRVVIDNVLHRLLEARRPRRRTGRRAVA